MRFGTDYVGMERQERTRMRNTKDGPGRCGEWGLTFAESVGMRNVLNGLRTMRGLEICSAGHENHRRQYKRALAE